MKRSTRKPPGKRNKDDYEVGYGRPPKATQFKKGTSGNKKGRPKETKDIVTIFYEEMHRMIPISQSGKRRTITIARAAIKQLTNKAATGDPKAIQTIINISKELGDLKLPNALQQPQRRKFTLNIFSKDLETGQRVRVTPANVREPDDNE